MVFKTTDPKHPGVKMVMEQGEVNLAGSIKVLSQGGFPEKYPELFKTPAETRALFTQMGWSKIACFQTRNPMHRSHEYLAKIAIEVCDGVLIHSLLGNLKPGDIPAEVRAKAIWYADRKIFRQKDRGSGRLSARHALCRSARGAVACRVPPELRLFAPDRRSRPCRRRQLLRPVRCASHFRPGSQGRAGNRSAEDRHLDFWCYKCGGMASAKTCPHDDADRLQVSRVRSCASSLSKGENVPARVQPPRGAGDFACLLREFARDEKVEVKLAVGFVEVRPAEFRSFRWSFVCNF